MGKLIHKTGDLFTSDAGALAHGVNTRGAMGSGIAVQFRDRYPEMYQEYRVQCADKTLEPGGMMGWIPESGPAIYNIASQDFPGPHAKIEWLSAGLWNALRDAEQRGIAAIAIPRIGSGIGGLPQEVVEAYVRGLAEASPVDVELWDRQ